MVLRYDAWARMNGYSWINGYEKHYGLVRLDFIDENKHYS